MDSHADCQLRRLPNNTFELVCSIPQEEVAKARQTTIAKLSAELEVPGFRKGKAPANLVKAKLDPGKIIDFILETVLPGYYQKGVQENSLKPIVAPKLEITSAEENQDWTVVFKSCEAPTVALDNYREALRQQGAQKEIWTPQKGAAKAKQPVDQEKLQQEKLKQTLDWLTSNLKVELSELLIEDEVNQLLSQLLQDVKKLGLTLDQYLTSTGKTADQLRSEYRARAERQLKLEFIITTIAEKENIQVGPQELDKIINEAKTAEDKAALEKQRYLLTSLIRRQKTLDFLASL